MRLVTILLLISSAATGFQQTRCGCNTAGVDKTTREGGNELIIERRSRPYKSIRGVVTDGTKPLANALVEVFDHPEWMISSLNSNRVKQQRVVACKTDAEGRFCFANIAGGKYELRVSQGIAWNVSHLYITVNAGSRQTTKALIAVRLRPGT